MRHLRVDAPRGRLGRACTAVEDTDPSSSGGELGHARTRFGAQQLASHAPTRGGDCVRRVTTRECRSGTVVVPA